MQVTKPRQWNRHFMVSLMQLLRSAEMPEAARDAKQIVLFLYESTFYYHSWGSHRESYLQLLRLWNEESIESAEVLILCHNRSSVHGKSIRMLSLTQDNGVSALFCVKLFSIKADKSFPKSSVSFQILDCEKKSILKMKFFLVVFAALLTYAAVSARSLNVLRCLLD